MMVMISDEDMRFARKYFRLPLGLLGARALILTNLSNTLQKSLTLQKISVILSEVIIIAMFWVLLFAITIYEKHRYYPTNQ